MTRRTFLGTLAASLLAAPLAAQAQETGKMSTSTAKAPGLTIPQPLRARADQVVK